jgi:lambda family phage portal protein
VVVRPGKKGLFAPSNLLSSGKRQYAAAKADRLTGDWFPVNQDVNTLIRTSSPMLRARIRQLVRDFAYFARAVKVRADFTVGSGMQFQSRVLNPNWRPGSREKKFDRAVCQQIEDAVAWAMEEMDAAGRQHFGELERLANMQDSESGEYLFVKTILKDKRRYIPYALMPYEADWLTSSYAAVARGNECDQGIEYDPLTGRVVAYHFAVPSGYGTLTASSRSVRVLAEQVIHNFDVKRPGQLRGVSAFVTAVLLAHDLSDYMDATIDTAKLAAKYLAIVETADVGRFQRTRTADGDGKDQGKKIETLENAIIEYLRPGEKISFAKSDPTGQTFDPFMKFVLHMFAIATDTPHSLLTGNYGDYAYTSLRGERQDFFKLMEPQQTRHIRHLTRPVICDAIDWAVLSGRLTLPGYWQNQRAYWRGVFIPPGGEPIDPLRESKANRDDMAAGLRSPQEIIMRRGRDAEEVLDEIAEFKEMCEERGLPFEAMMSTETALANNPAANGAEEDGGTGGTGKGRLLRLLRSEIETAALLKEEV